MKTKQQTHVHNNKSYESYVLRRVERSLKSIPLEYKRAFAKDFQKVIDNNGKEYTLQRYKDIKQIILTSASHYHTFKEFPIITQLPRKGSSFIRMKSNHKVMAGYLGQLQLLACRSPKCLEQVIQLIHAYGLITDDDTTPEDIEKLSEVIEPRVQDKHKEYIDRFCSNINGAKLQKLLHTQLRSYEYERTTYMLGDDCITKNTEIVKEDKSFLLRKPIGKPSNYMLAPMFEAHENSDYIAECISFCKSELYTDMCELIPGLEDALPQINYTGSIKNPYYPVGRMFLINEPGLKKRWVQNTKHIFQHIFRPFGERLYDIVRYLPWDCTFDESKGIRIIQNALFAGQTCHSVDLSKATDKIPMEYNVSVLEKLLSRIPDAKGYIQSFYKLSRSQVALPDITENFPEYKRMYTRWNTGQPMGSYPSFAMLTLVHGLILFILNDYKWEGKWVVHGDDIVILDDELKEKYTKFLEESGMEYSPYKTISGTYFAEMNSKIITADKVLSPVKWKEISTKNLLDVAPFWSVDMIARVCANKKVSHTAIEAILALPYPFGAGLNPKGLSLEERFNAFPGLLEDYFNESDSGNYIGSYRDLISFRYSNFGTLKKSQRPYHNDIVNDKSPAYYMPYGERTLTINTSVKRGELLLVRETKQVIDRQCIQLDKRYKNLRCVSGEMDVECLQAYLRDMEAADKLDQSLCHDVLQSHGDYFFRNAEDYTHICRSWLFGKYPGRLPKPCDTKLVSKTKERKKELKTRFSKALEYYCPTIEMNKTHTHAH